MKPKPAKATKKRGAREATVEPVVAKPEPTARPTLREALLAEMVEVEETEHAVGFNQGMREALRIVDARIKSTDMRDIDQLSLENLRLAYRELREQDERQKEKTQGAMAGLRAKGEKTGGQAPFGYRTVSRDDNTLIEDAREQAVIAEVRRLRNVDKLSIRKIVIELWKNRKKMHPRPIQNQERPKGRRIGEFDSMQIRRMLQTNKQIDELKKKP